MSKYLALDSGLPGFPQDSVSHGTWEFGLKEFWISPTRLSRSLAYLSRQFGYPQFIPQPSRNPSILRHWFRLLRFRSPLTYAISIDFFSSCYLDVSVHSVPLRLTPDPYKRGVSPFGHRRISASWQLPDDFRGHVRPSSALTSTGIHCLPCVQIHY